MPRNCRPLANVQKPLASIHVLQPNPQVVPTRHQRQRRIRHARGAVMYLPLNMKELVQKLRELAPNGEAE